MGTKKKLNILIVSPYFYPENFRVNDIAQDLVQRGHSVTVLTGQPNYPDPDLFKEFRKRKVKSETWGGVQIHRVPIITRGRGGGIRRILNYLSFILSAPLFGFSQFKNKTFDVSFVWASSPITSAIPALVWKWKTGTPVIVWVQDLWPETLKAVGVLKSKWGLQLVGLLVRWIYKHCNLLLAQSEGFVTALRRWAPSLRRDRRRAPCRPRRPARGSRCFLRLSPTPLSQRPALPTRSSGLARVRDPEEPP